MAPEDSVVAEALAGAIGAENVDIITPQDPLLRAVEGFQGTLSVHARPNSVDDVQAVDAWWTADSGCLISPSTGWEVHAFDDTVLAILPEPEPPAEPA